MIKLYIGGSPCTRWSIAQTKNRETEPSGLGWELFQNYVIGLQKYKPDYFLYENNKSMSPAIKAQITKELGVEPILINSALVAAQNRNRLYWSNIPGITQPEDKGILLRDILETGTAWREKSYTLDANYYRTAGTYDPTSQHSYSRHMAAEPVYPFGTSNEGKAYTLTASYGKGPLPENTLERKQRSMVIEPVRIGTIESTAQNTDFDSQQYRVYSPEGQSVTLCGNGGGVGAKTGLYAVPITDPPAALRYERTETAKKLRKAYESREIKHGYHEFHELHPRQDGKSNTITTVLKDNMIIERWDGKTYPVYEVLNSQITIKGKQYPIKLPDGYYIIRKLTVKECMRLQTVPDTYVFPVGDSQSYKMLGNGWTVDVIAHQLSFIPGITTEEIEVVSMYDGMSCGHIALDKLGANVVRYYASEIDKYAIQTAKHNYPMMEHIGDAYQVREPDWRFTAKSGKLYSGNVLMGQMSIDDWLAV